MHVVQVLPELNEGGVERGTVELSRELVARGISSTVISNGGRLAEVIEQDGGRYCRLDVCSKNPLTAPARIRRLRRLLMELRPDILHARSRVPAWLCQLANRSPRIPFVTTVHGFNSVNAYSRVMTFGDKVICVSGAIRDYVKQHYGVPDAKLVVIPRGVDLESFNPDNLDREFMARFRADHGLEGRWVVTSVGRITQLKDFETFIDAIAGLRRDMPDILGLIVGGVREDKRTYLEVLKRRAGDKQLAGHLLFTGSQKKIAEIYALSDVVVSSSKKPESFGRAAAEALAMEVPVIATAHGGVLDIVLDGRTGFLFAPGDCDELGQRIQAARGQTFRDLRQYVATNFNLDLMVEKTVSVYNELSVRRENGIC
ncbi:glycosyl transferase [Geothermobacter hydrogeniphilus]|uniref:Glycosyl transferase n=1 Tax=Geothermobacter hydrogeniphilus TaxID=1969733 RepID=A0A2K2HCG7_9BACT|nr:glycosyl transferase [Geothermobacter hydrogeniphilus]